MEFSFYVLKFIAIHSIVFKYERFFFLFCIRPVEEEVLDKDMILQQKEAEVSNYRKVQSHLENQW